MNSLRKTEQRREPKKRNPLLATQNLFCNLVTDHAMYTRGSHRKFYKECVFSFSVVKVDSVSEDW